MSKRTLIFDGCFNARDLGGLPTSQGNQTEFGAGRDRTGLISAMVLYLAGVSVDVIADDHFLSHANLTRMYEARCEPDQWLHFSALMSAAGKTTFDVLSEMFRDLNVRSLLLENGLSEADISALRRRLIA